MPTRSTAGPLREHSVTAARPYRLERIDFGTQDFEPRDHKTTTGSLRHRLIRSRDTAPCQGTTRPPQGHNGIRIGWTGIITAVSKGNAAGTNMEPFQSVSLENEHAPMAPSRILLWVHSALAPSQRFSSNSHG